jgi:hypothetical protein
LTTVEGDELSKHEKWAEELSSHCGIFSLRDKFSFSHEGHGRNRRKLLRGYQDIQRHHRRANVELSYGQGGASEIRSEISKNCPPSTLASSEMGFSGQRAIRTKSGKERANGHSIVVAHGSSGDSVRPTGRS